MTSLDPFDNPVDQPAMLHLSAIVRSTRMLWKLIG
jgi:hypothetical protein